MPSVNRAFKRGNESLHLMVIHAVVLRLVAMVMHDVVLRLVAMVMHCVVLRLERS